MNEEELAEQGFPPPSYLIEGLLQPGLSILGGASKIGKSWLVLRLGMRVSQGLPVWGRPTRRCEVLYLCLEDTYSRIQRRMYRLNEEPEPNLHFAVASELLHGGLEDQIEAFLQEHPDTGLVIIDTLQKVRPPRADNGNQYANDYEDVGSLKRLADRHGIAVLLIHHLRKTKDRSDPFNELSGSTGLMGALDTCFLLKKDYRESDTATLLVTGRDVEDQELTLRFADCVWELVERTEEEKALPNQFPPFLFSLARFMRGQTKWEGTATELLETLGETEVKARGVVRCFCRFYSDFLEPRGISFHTRRTGQSRLIYLQYDSAADRHDEDDECDVDDEHDEADSGDEAEGNSSNDDFVVSDDEAETPSCSS